MSRAAWLGLVCVLLFAGLVVLTPLTDPDRGIRVEATSPPATSYTPPQTDSGPADLPFSAEDVRSALLDQSNGSQPEVDPRTLETLLYCADCLSLSDPLAVAGERFQIAHITDPSSDSVFSAAVIGEEAGEPSLMLIVSGHELSLTPGREGTLVVQESQYGPADKVCCPSGWSVQVYRYRDGAFEAGQQISQPGEQ